MEPHIIALIVGGTLVLGAVISFISMKVNQNSRENWLATHSDFAKIELASENGIFIQKDFHAQVISGEAAFFAEGTKYIIYAAPGNVTLEVSYTYIRPGVLYKKVSRTWGPTKVEIQVESGKEYKLSFDKDKEQFKLTSK
ncbi:hypothetical protein [Bulleidia sp. zg-1006]|uniref:hypothetical protein n=1 Tax=Bulleidia sp. zg-1006 TaxID=2806552 RepID=UPI0019395136|nr:hypothetical protein [Bulleidia sp. zg-1006]QRG87025.1 hypothetical protein JOS54_01575 [Bulleidia sp. zg-1006]